MPKSAQPAPAPAHRRHHISPRSMASNASSDEDPRCREDPGTQGEGTETDPDVSGSVTESECEQTEAEDAKGAKIKGKMLPRKKRKFNNQETETGALLRSIVSSQRDTDRKIVEQRADHNKDISSFARQLVQVAKDAREEIGVVNFKVTKVSRDVDDVKGDVTIVKEDVTILKEKLERMQKAQISSNDGDVFLRFLPVLCDGASGKCAWVPVYHTAGDVTYQLVVVHLGYVERYFSQECPVRKTAHETRAYFTTKLPLHDRLPYDHHQSVLAHCTPFISNSTGRKSGFSCCQAVNRNKFVFLKFLPMKEMLDKVHRHMDDVPTTRVKDVDGRSVSYKVFGQTWKFTQRSRNDHSTTPIKPFGSRTISPDLKKFMLARDFPWTSSNYDKAKEDFFGIPPEFVGKRHVVCGRFDRNSAEVHSHEAQYEKGRTTEVGINNKKKGSSSFPRGGGQQR